MVKGGVRHLLNLVREREREREEGGGLMRGMGGGSGVTTRCTASKEGGDRWL
jgi:hypothetical protein